MEPDATQNKVFFTDGLIPDSFYDTNSICVVSVTGLMLKIYIVKLEGVKEINATLCRCNRWLPILELIGVPLLEPVTHMPPHVGACYFHSRCLPMLPVVGMSAGL